MSSNNGTCQYRQKDVNTFEEPEDPAVKMAMDVVEDDYIDATDLAYISYIANFEE